MVTRSSQKSSSSGRLAGMTQVQDQAHWSNGVRGEAGAQQQHSWKAAALQGLNLNELLGPRVEGVQGH